MTKTTTEYFLNRSKEPKHADESHLAEAFVRADRELGEQKIRLLDHLSAEKKSDGKVVPVFDSGVEDVLPDLERANKEAAAVNDNIHAYLNALGDFDSVQAMTERMLRLKRTADNLDRDVANLSKQAVTRGIERPQDDPAVMDAAVKRDRVVAESSAEVADLQKRISRAKEIVEGY